MHVLGHKHMARQTKLQYTHTCIPCIHHTSIIHRNTWPDKQNYSAHIPAYLVYCTIVHHTSIIHRNMHSLARWMVVSYLLVHCKQYLYEYLDINV